MDGNLQSMIQIFIRVVFRCVGRQEEHLHLLPVLLQLGCGKLTVMHLQIIQNQEHFLL